MLAALHSWRACTKWRASRSAQESDGARHTLKGPGVFVAAEVSNQGGSNEVDPVGRTTGRGLLVGFSAAPLS